MDEPENLTVSLTEDDCRYLVGLLYRAAGGHGHLTDKFRDALASPE